MGAGSITADGRTPGDSRPAPLIITEDDALLDDLLRLCAAAGAQAEVAQHAPPAEWGAAPLVLVGDDCAARVADAGLPRRAGVLLIGRGPDDGSVWRGAVALGADDALFLPVAEKRLVERIADAVEGAGPQALTVGVIGGRGGAGASTLACALAVTAARAGLDGMLVDADPWGGGLDVLLGAEGLDGPRWPAFAKLHGRIGGGVLADSLPAPHGLRLLSWDRGDCAAVPPEAVRSVLAAARRRGGVVVVDLPRRVDEAVGEVLAQLDLGLLVVPAEVRAVAAAGRVAAEVGPLMRDLRVVVRGPGASGLDAVEIARLLKLPLVGEVPAESGLAAAGDGGGLPGSRAGGALARFCRGFWTAAVPRMGEVAA